MEICFDRSFVFCKSTFFKALHFFLGGLIVEYIIYIVLYRILGESFLVLICVTSARPERRIVGDLGQGSSSGLGGGNVARVKSSL